MGDRRDGRNNHTIRHATPTPDFIPGAFISVQGCRPALSITCCAPLMPLQLMWPAQNAVRLILPVVRTIIATVQPRKG